MSSWEKKRKQKEPSPTTSYISLPDDLLLSCFARVPRLYYPTLSLVSKSFRSLLASPKLYKARSLLGHTDSCLYVCIYFFSYRSPRWFTLCRKPDKTLNNDTSKTKKPSGYVLARALIPHSPVNLSGGGLVAVGSSIYNIGGSSSSNGFSILDCMTHTWHEAPSFPVKLMSLTASVVDRKIYVAGCYNDGDPYYLKDSIQVLDTETQTWDPLPPIPRNQGKYNHNSKSACIDGKFQLETETEVVAYNSKEGRWDLVRRWMYYGTNSDPFCEIENVMYSVSVSDGAFTWYDTEARKWKDLKGLVGLPKFPRNSCVSLADYGGKMVVLWDEDLPRSGGHHTMIWCAEIALERRKIYGIWGKVEWFDHVLTVPEICDVVKVLAATF